VLAADLMPLVKRWSSDRTALSKPAQKRPTSQGRAVPVGPTILDRYAPGLRAQLQPLSTVIR
jgi:hypothetical protein